jgi:secondary thiamine-phosphate synthase enzyme
LITQRVIDQLPKLPEKGVLHLFICHTSAGLTINENADPTVRDDLDTSFNRLIPENERFYIHTTEGADDMPAHVKSSLVGQALTIPITRHRLNLGTWQGIYLCEFRHRGGKRKLIATLLS